MHTLPIDKLFEYFGVSRVTVREGLRALETVGLIQTRPGSGGGAIVSVPSRQRVEESLADFLQMADISAVAVTEARFVLELES